MRRQKRTATMTVRFPPDEAALLREEARRRGVSYSSLLRMAVFAYAGRCHFALVVPGDNQNVTIDYRRYDEGRVAS